MWRLRRCVLRITAAEIGAVRTVAATAAMPPTTAVHSEAVLATVALIITVPGILLRLPAASDERRQAAQILPAFRAALAGLLVGLLVMLRLVMLRLVMLLRVMLLLVMLLLVRPIVHLLIARRERLRIAWNIWLLLRLRRIARLVLSHERLRVIVVAVEPFVVALLLSAARALLLRLLLIVVGVLLPELFLSGGDQTEIMLGVLVVILGCHRITGPLRVTRKLNVFFCNMGSGAADFHVGTVRFINTRERILAFAVIAAPPHSLLTVSHVLPVRRPFNRLGVHRRFASPYKPHCAAGPATTVRANDRIVAFLSR